MPPSATKSSAGPRKLFRLPQHGLITPLKKKLIVPGGPKVQLVVKKPLPKKVTLADVGKDLSLDAATQAIIDQIKDEAEQLADPIMRALWLDAVQIFASTGNVESLIAVCEWRRPVCPIEQFLFDPAYLSLNESEVFPGVVEACLELDTDKYHEAVLTGGLGTGKALDVSTPIPTPRGWVDIGDIKTGDRVFDENGRPCRVTFAHEIMHKRKCYEVVFSDGERIVADEDHLWYTETKVGALKKINPRIGRVVTTKQIAATLKFGRENNHRIPLTKPLILPARDFPIDPYVLGAWLGDGASATDRFYCDDQDIGIVEEMRKAYYHVERCDQNYTHDRCPTYRIETTHRARSFYQILDEIGVRGNKHIPHEYLWASKAQRIALLQGLMDTDGCCSRTVCEYVTKFPALAEGVMDLLRSLGIKSTRREKIVKGRTYYRIAFTAYRDLIPAFRLSRKLDLCPTQGAQAIRQLSRYVVDVRRVPSRPVRCLTVDSASRLYLAGRGMVPTHNTTIANFMLARQIYKISCMRNPQATFGVQSKSSLVFTIQSVRLGTARKAVFEEFGQYVRSSPYFKNVYPYDYKVVSEMIFREQRVKVMPVSSSTTGVISMNVVAGVMDEANFMQKILKSKSSEADEAGIFDQAKKLYATLVHRRKSRFVSKGKLPGTMFVISSSRFPDDFTEHKAAESTMEGGSDAGIYVYRKSLWTAKRRDTFQDGDFRVQIGTAQIRSKVLEDNEEPYPGCEVIDVPMDFYEDFKKNVDQSLCDFAGRTTLALKPFISRRDAIQECFAQGERHGYKNIFQMEEIDLSRFPDLSNVAPIFKENINRIVAGERHVHVDLGVNKDAAGLSISHVAGTKIVERIDPNTGRKEWEILPVIGYDGIVRIVPPVGGEIEFANIRELLIVLRDVYKLPIKYVTFDGYQSVDSRQILKHLGFISALLSVEPIEPYRTFRDGIYDGRILFPKHNWLANELVGLQLMRKNSKEKVDHRPNATKDVADAACATYAFWMSRRSAWLGAVAGTHEMEAMRDAMIAKAADREGKRPEVERREITTRRNVVRTRTHRKAA